MATLHQSGQFINEPGQYFLDALADPPAGAVSALAASVTAAQEVGDVIADNNVTWKYTHADSFKDAMDEKSMGSYVS